MRSTKSGEPAISKSTWRAKAGAHRQISDEIEALLAANAGAPSGIAESLASLQHRHSELADICKELEAETKRGRPTARKPQRNALMGPIDLPRKPGRPTEHGPKFDRMTYKVVEARRAELAVTNLAKPTIKAAIESLNRERAQHAGRHAAGDYLKNEYQRINSSYQRGQRLVERDQNP